MNPMFHIPLGRLALAAILIAPIGCGSASDELPRQAISGTVTIDDKPLDAGSITFDPVDMGRKDAVNAGAAISGGSYSIAAATGLTPGSYRVSITEAAAAAPASTNEAPGTPPRATHKATIPATYNVNSTLTAEVKPDGNGPFDFPLKSK